MVAVTTTPICGRLLNEGAETWAPGTLTFVSGRQELRDFEQWCSYIRSDNPGPQKVLLLTPQPEVEPSGTAEAALRASEKLDPGFDIVDVVHTDGTVDGAAEELRVALQAHPDTTIIASVRPELTRAAAQVAVSRSGARLRIYDFGGGSDVLNLIENREVVMTRPQFPVEVGAMAVQALYDARVGRTPILRYHSSGGFPAQAGPPAETWAAVTAKNLALFRATGLGQY
jgi:ribose transport system substrate-binding protein